MKQWPILLLSLPMLAMAAEPAPLGRLFLTPGERAALDTIRQNNRPPEKIITPGTVTTGENEESTRSPAAPVVTVHGYVKRSDGKGTVWVNGQPLQEKSIANNIEIGKLQGNTNDVQIKLPSTGQTVKLKAGQSYDPGSGKVADHLKDLPHDPLASTAVPQTKTSVAPVDTTKGNGAKDGIAADGITKPASTPPSVR